MEEIEGDADGKPRDEEEGIAMGNQKDEKEKKDHQSICEKEEERKKKRERKERKEREKREKTEEAAARNLPEGSNPPVEVPNYPSRV